MGESLLDTAAVGDVGDARPVLYTTNTSAFSANIITSMHFLTQFIILTFSPTYFLFSCIVIQHSLAYKLIVLLLDITTTNTLT